MTVCGFCLGAAYDLLGILRRGGMTGAADVLFGAVCALAMIGTGMALQADVFRLYAFMGVLAGAVVYAATMGTIVRRLSGSVQKMMDKRKNLTLSSGKMQE